MAAERFAREAIELASGTGWEASALFAHGAALAERGDLDAADAATSRALHVALNAGLESWFRMALRGLARIAAARSRFEDAALLLGASGRMGRGAARSGTGATSIERRASGHSQGVLGQVLTS